ncbi:MAG: CHAT domain-containing protein [Acidobacteriota bacterium]
MTHDPGKTDQCPGDETMAAFLDNRLAPDARNQVIAHLAGCQSCYELLADAAQVLGSSNPGDAASGPHRLIPAVPPARRRSAVFYAVGAGLLAAAAVIATVLLPRGARTEQRPELVELVAAAGTTRFSDARLTGGFQWGTPDSAFRGGTSVKASPEVQIAAAKLDQALARDRSAANLAAYGTSRLPLGDARAAVASLEEATSLAPTHADYWSDLAASYLSRSQDPGSESDLFRALEAAEKSVALSPTMPEAWFNKALALERLHLTSQAIDAWTRYLALDTSSDWRQEATRRLDALRSPRPTGRNGAPTSEQVRQAIFDTSLPKWSTASAAGVDDSTSFDALQAAADRLGATPPDPFTRDMVAAIALARGSAALRASSASGHAAYLRGQAAYARDQFDDATSALSVARRDLERIRSPLVLTTRFTQAVIVFRRRDNDASHDLLIALRPEVASHGYHSLLGKIDWTLGLLDALGGRRREAGQRYESAVREFAAANDDSNGAIVQGLLATNYDNLGDAATAWTLRLRTLAGSPRAGDLLSISIAASKRGWLRTALALEQAALAAATADDSAPNIADALRVEAAIRAQFGDQASVRHLVASARSLVVARQEPAWDRVRAEIGLAEAQVADDTQLAAALETSGRSIEFFSRTGADGRVPELRLVRAQLQRRAGDRSAARDELRRGMAALEEQRRHLEVGTFQATFENVERGLVNELVALVDSDQAARAAFVTVDDGRGRDAEPGALATFSIADLQAAMPPGLALAEYVVTPESTYVWVISAKQDGFRRLAIGMDSLAALVTASVAPRSDGAATRKLAATLLTPIAEVAGVFDRLVVVPDGPLHGLPFALLPGGDGAVLVERAAITAAPSARSWLSATRRLAAIGARTQSIVAVGNPLLDSAQHPGLPALPEAETEANETTTPYAASRVVAREEATRAALVRALQTADILHFAGHAVQNPSVTDASYLALAGPTAARLTAAEVRKLPHVTARLVVLAACETASDDRTRQDTPLSLARAFFAAGVPDVIGNLWPVSDRASRALFQVFHREFARTGDAAGALRTAQITLARSTDPALASPAAWAGFTLMGGTSRN